MLLLKATTETIQITNTLPGLVPTLKGSAYLSPGTSNTLTIAPGTSISIGDWMILTITTISGTTITTAPSGWTQLQALTTAGSLVTVIYAKNYTLGDTSYATTLSANGTASSATLIWGSGADVIANWVIGSNLLRASISPATTTNNVAPSITTTSANNLVLVISTESTTANEAGITSMTAAAEWFFGPQFSSTQVQTTTIGYIQQLSAGATSNVTIVYPNTSSTNGMAIQIGIPFGLGSLDYSVSYTDTTSSTTNLSSNEGIITGATTTTITPAPAASTDRLIKLITVSNVDPYVNNTVTFQKNISGTAYQLESVFTLLPGETVQYMDRKGWKYYSATGVIKADQTVINSSSTQLEYNASGVLDSTTNSSYTAIWTKQSGSGSLAWSCIASSADGTMLFAGVISGHVYTSTDSGVTWTQQTGSPSQDWGSISCSADGTEIIAAPGVAGYLYISIDSGVTWTQQTGAGSNLWGCVASVPEGGTFAAAISGGNIYTYYNGGTWTLLPGSTSQSWTAMTTSYAGDVFAAAVLGGYIYTSIGGASLTQQTSSTSQNWVTITSSSDGTHLAAAADTGYIYTSTNSGVTWTQQTGSTSQAWLSITSSSDGTHLAAAADTGYIYTSTNSGVTWTQRPSSIGQTWGGVASSADGTKLLILPGSNGYLATIALIQATTPTWTTTNNTVTPSASTVGFNNSLVQQTGSTSQTWGGVASSSDGTKLVAVSTGYIYTSTDSGVTWTQQTGSTSQTWGGVASSSDGTKLVAVSTGYIYTSTDSGVTWTQQTGSTSQTWWSVASSADGTKLVAGVKHGYIYTSTDSGVTWTQQTGSTLQSWAALASSADGTHLIAGIYGGYVYTSTDSGVTWTLSIPNYNDNWNGVASSADGTKFAAVGFSGAVFTSTNSGVTWTQQASLPQLYGLVSSADGTKLAATTNVSYIYTSTNSGVTWTKIGLGTGLLRGIAMSSDGVKIIPQALTGYIYTYTMPLLETNTLSLTSSPTLTLNEWTIDPSSAPATNTLSVYARATASNGIVSILDAAFKPVGLQSALWQPSFILWTPGAAAGTWTGTAGATAGGTAASVLPTTTNVYTAMRRSTFSNVVTTTNQQLGLRSEIMFLRGSTTGMGGFFFSCRFGFDVIATGCRAFIGFCPSTTIVSADPSTSLNTLGFGFDLADTAFSFYHNGASGTATKEPITGQGTLATNDTGYDAYIWSPQGSATTVYYRLDRTDTGATLVDSSVNTNLPVNTTTLMATAQMSNGTANLTVNSAVIGVNRLYVETIR